MRGDMILVATLIVFSSSSYQMNASCASSFLLLRFDIDKFLYTRLILLFTDHSLSLSLTPFIR